jgi:inorganic pyrophosphatase
MTEAKDFLNKPVSVTVDRSMGSRHPQYGFVYPLNYGFVPDTIMPDGEEIDAYILGVFAPCDKFDGVCIAYIQRLDDMDDKLIVVPQGVMYNDMQIRALTEFQERFFRSRIIHL